LSARAADPAGPLAGPRLRLAVIVNLYPPYVVGGNEILARDVVEALKERGHSVHVITGRGRELPADGFTHGVLDLDLDRKEDAFQGGLPLTAARALRWHLYHHATYRAVRGTLARLEPQLVVAWNLYGVSMAPLAAARRFPWPVVAQPADRWLLWGLSDISGIVPATRALPRLALRLVRGLVQPLLRRRARPDYVLAVSDFIRRLHVEAGFPAAQSCTTHLGVHVEAFSAPERRFPAGRPWRLAFAGQLWAGKGPQVAVDALAALREHAPGGVELDVFGGGSPDFIAHLERRILERGLAGAARLRGFVSRETLAREFRGHDLFLFCSTWDEPFSLGLLEALCAGLPAIATTAGGTPEAVEHERNGLLVPPGDAAALASAVVRLMNDPALYLRLGQEAAADVRRRWRFDQYVSRLERTYAAIVAGHGPGRPAVLSA
jgi:glycosyltransferase involved in cell wall biosynthesis